MMALRYKIQSSWFMFRHPLQYPRNTLQYPRNTSLYPKQTLQYPRHTPKHPRNTTGFLPKASRYYNLCQKSYPWRFGHRHLCRPSHQLRHVKRSLHSLGLFTLCRYPAGVFHLRPRDQRRVFHRLQLLGFGTNHPNTLSKRSEMIYLI